jgi:antirestriction protein ArdC
MSHKADTVFEGLTAQFIARIEEGLAGEWSKPWVDFGEGIARNASTGKAYRGGNVLITYATAAANGWEGPWWATYRQWDELGAQVRKGEKSTRLIFWKFIERSDDDGNVRRIPFANVFNVFHAAQVEGWEAPEAPERDTPERVAEAEAFFAAVGADVRHGGDRAYYSPTGDYIGIPQLEQFSEAPAYYATLGHEHAHWTGRSGRCARDLSGRFGSESYAAEELVAELTSAFLCATLGLSSTPRPDHAAYLANWLKVLRDDSKALWKAASLAQQAHDYLCRAAGVLEDAPAEDAPAIAA